MKDNIKIILLESLKAIEKTIEKDLNQPDEAKKISKHIAHFLKYVGIDMVEKLAIEGKMYIQHQIEEGVHKTTHVLAKVVSSLINLIILFLVVCVGLVFGAVAFSLWLGELIENNALGFLIAGVLWIVVAIIATKILFNKERLEKIIGKKIHS